MAKLTRSRSKFARIARRVLLVIASLVVLAIAGFLIWANVGVMAAEPDPLAQVRDNPGISLAEYSDAVVMSPTSGASGVGLVFIPGAKVAPEAYLFKLSGVVQESGLTVVVTKPILNLAFFDQRPLTTFTDHASSVSSWYVGGHSLGGVRACQYAQQPDVAGLILFGSYCANDLSESHIPVLSLSGSADGLSTPSKISGSANLLPRSADFVTIEGANHASFGDYGVQPGDGTATLSSQQVAIILTDKFAGFLAAH
jgi:Alpha/beta hydrolase family